MVVLRPLLEGERIRVCSCGHLGLSSPVRERSSYYPKHRTARYGQFMAMCKNCAREKNRQYRSTPEAKRRAKARMQSREKHPIAARSPEEQAELRARWRAAKRREKERDPEGARLRYNETKRRSYHRKLERIGREAMREERRFDLMRKRELAGKPLPTVAQDKTGTSGVKWPSEPYWAFLDGLLKEASRDIAISGNSRSGELSHGSHQMVAHCLGISERRLYDHLRSPTVDERIVERACARHGSVHPGDLYPHAYGRGPTIWGSGTPRDPYHVLPEGWSQSTKASGRPNVKDGSE